MESHALGFPRIGAKRELKRALERYWLGVLSEAELLAEANRIKQWNWSVQKKAGLSLVATGDFSFYDHVLDAAVMFGAVPERFKNLPEGSLERYFAMARGDAKRSIAAMEMTKWFDTNYHYIVPEFEKGMEFKLSSGKLVEETKLAKAAGFRPKPVVIGPLTFVALGKSRAEESFSSLLKRLLPAYQELLGELSSLCDWIQIDEPILCMELSEEIRNASPGTLNALRAAAGEARLLLASYFGGVGENLDLILNSGFDAFHADFVYGEWQLGEILRRLPPTMSLSAGLVDGRNVWKADLSKASKVLSTIMAKIGSERTIVASSCSLLHSPVDLTLETELKPEMKERMAFAVQKCAELARLAEGHEINEPEASAAPGTFEQDVRIRCAAVNEGMLRRKSPYAKRRQAQAEWLKLPLLPTTTIGSFPQTADLREERQKFKKGQIGEAEYDCFIKGLAKDAISRQEELGLDVLVHGEFERNDMVEYFGEQLKGFLFTQNGWVQSYGSRCVKPPVIYGDVSRPKPMTVEWIGYAQSLSSKPVKGMLTGPVTILNWSFVRTDISRAEVCRQIALAIRDEVCDLERAGVKIIQIDEAALRERLPLRRSEWDNALGWMVDCFKLASSGVADATQIHTHMCYSEFNAIIRWIAAMDADVVSVESSRSGMELLESFKSFEYPNEIGPGVYDIHSPRVPSVEEIIGLIKAALKWVPSERLWINPDCGLKTRAWPETMASLKNMVEAARTLRTTL